MSCLSGLGLFCINTNLVLGYNSLSLIPITAFLCIKAQLFQEKMRKSSLLSFGNILWSFCFYHPLKRIFWSRYIYFCSHSPLNRFFLQLYYFFATKDYRLSEVITLFFILTISDTQGSTPESGHQPLTFPILFSS